MDFLDSEMSHPTKVVHACLKRVTLRMRDKYQTLISRDCDFQQSGILTSVTSDEPVQPPFNLQTPNAVRSVP